MKLKSIMTAICVLATANLAAAAPFAYVANSGTKTVSIIDTVDNTIKATVPLTGSNPFAYSVAVGASGQYVYVGVQDLNQVQIIDAATRAVVQAIGLGTDIPGGLAVNAAETRLYVTSSKSNTLIIIDITGKGATEVARLAVEDAAISNPEGVVLSPAGDKAYVANSATGTVAEIALDEESNVYTRTSLTTVGGSPMGLALSSTGSKLYVANLTGAAAVVDTATKAVTLLYTPAPVTPVSGVLSIAVRPDDTKAYAPSSTVDKIYVIDGGVTNAVSATQYSATQAPYGSAIAPNNNLYMAMNLSNEVEIFNTTTNSPLTSITIPSVPTAPRPTSLFGNFIGPNLQNTITSAAQAGCTISPLGAVQVNAKGRSFDITATSGTCEVFTGCNTTTFAGGTSQGFPTIQPFTTVTGNPALDTICAINIPTGTYYTLTTDWISSVSGWLFTSPTGVNIEGKTAKFLTGQVVIIKAPTTTTTPAAPYDYVAKNWTGACAGTTGGTCTITMDGNKTVGAVVELAPTGTGPIWNVTKGTYHQTLTEATLAASTNDIIKVTKTYTAGCGSTPGGATMVTLSGNWLSDYSGQSGSTSAGAFTITTVGIIADNLTL